MWSLRTVWDTCQTDVVCTGTSGARYPILDQTCQLSHCSLASTRTEEGILPQRAWSELCLEHKFDKEAGPKKGTMEVY